jgi:diguanylate cyclase (GGDEF)-like protein
VVAERLRAAVASQIVHFDGQRIRYTVSAGVASLDDGEGGIDLLLKRADQALYAAKRAGRNRVERWRPEMGALPLHPARKHEKEKEGGRDAA